MKASWTTGFSFGLTSGIITTLGLIVGLHAGTHSRVVVLGGILTITISDAMSDALGIHIIPRSNQQRFGAACVGGDAGNFSFQIPHCHDFCLSPRPISSQQSSDNKCNLGLVPTQRLELLRRQGTIHSPLAANH